jgi:paraquat-inducible protein B
MKNLIKRKPILSVLMIGAALFTLLFYAGCSTAGDEVQSFRRGGDAPDKVLTFYERSKGDDVKWKVYFKNDEISEVYKDGVRLSKNEMEDYRGLIYKKASGLVNGSKNKSKKFSYTFNDNLSKEMKKLGEDLKKQKIKIKANIDKDLKNELKELTIELKKLKDNDIKLWMNKDGSDKEFQFNFDFNTDEFNEQMKTLFQSLENIDIKIDIPDININLEGLEENMKDLELNLNDLNKELEGINSFFKELRSELVKDNLIESENEDMRISFKEGGMYINEKMVPEKLLQKYKEMYKKHTGKDLKEKHYFNLN